MDALKHHFALLSTPCVERELKKQLRRDRIAHLRSIDLDSQFVRAVHRGSGSPVIFANLRCGIWYVPPDLSAGTCYFKSTDGHAGRWGFSLSRLNLQAALSAARHGCVMIVDSTRSGKRFPDALTKTVPIWCCVINRALSRAHAHEWPRAWQHALWLPQWIALSEAAQVERLIDGWVAELCSPALAPVLEQLRRHVRRPLRPFWCCPEQDVYDGAAEWHRGRAHGEGVDSRPAVEGVAGAADGREWWQPVHAASVDGEAPAEATDGPGHYGVYCVCASAVRSAATSREHHSWTYVQGAGDDEENWSGGLRAEDWWRWRDSILRLSAASPEAAEAELSRLQASRLRRGEASPSAPESGAEEAAQLTLADREDSADPRAAADQEDCADPRVPQAATPHWGWSEGVATPIPLWESGLYLGTAACGASAGVWDVVDALIHVGSARSYADLAPLLSGQAADGAMPEEHRRAGDPGTVDPQRTGDVRAKSDCSRCCHVALEDGKRAQPSKDWWQR